MIHPYERMLRGTRNQHALILFILHTGLVVSALHIHIYIYVNGGLWNAVCYVWLYTVYEVDASSAERGEMLQIFVEFLYGWAFCACFGWSQTNGKWKTNRIWMEHSKRCVNVIHFKHSMLCNSLDATTKFIYCEKCLLFAFILGRTWVPVYVCMCVCLCVSRVSCSRMLSMHMHMHIRTRVYFPFFLAFQFHFFSSLNAFELVEFLFQIPTSSCWCANKKTEFMYSFENYRLCFGVILRFICITIISMENNEERKSCTSVKVQSRVH